MKVLPVLQPERLPPFSMSPASRVKFCHDLHLTLQKDEMSSQATLIMGLVQTTERTDPTKR